MNTEEFVNEKLPCGMTNLQAAQFLAKEISDALKDCGKKLDEIGIKVREDQREDFINMMYHAMLKASAATMTVYC